MENNAVNTERDADLSGYKARGRRVLLDVMFECNEDVIIKKLALGDE